MYSKSVIPLRVSADSETRRSKVTENFHHQVPICFGFLIKFNIRNVTNLVTFQLLENMQKICMLMK